MEQERGSSPSIPSSHRLGLLHVGTACRDADCRTGPAWREPALAVVLVAYLALAVAYGLATPILEASDENWHEAVVWQIMSGHGLPILNPTERGHVLVPAQEAGQPPLYYLLAAGATFWVHPPNPAAVLLPSPNAAIGRPDRSPWNKNLFVHTAAEAFPWHGLALAVHLQRLLSTLFGAVTVVAVYLLARLVLPGSRPLALLATAFVAFNPMFLFISASVDNDALAIALSALILLALAHVLRSGATTRQAALTGLLLGLATLTKLSAAAVALPALAVFLWEGRRERSLERGRRYLIALVVPAAALSGWWFLRNWRLYGDPLGLAAFVQVAGVRPQALSWQELVAESRSIWSGFWGVFGIFDILLPPFYYAAAEVLLVLAGLGLLVRIGRSLLWRPGKPAIDVTPIVDRVVDRVVDRAILAMLVGWLLLEVVLLVRWTAATQASSGRLLFPALSSVAVLVALGFVSLAGRRQRLVSLLLALTLALGGALAVPLAILPAYAAPVFVPAGTLRPAVRLGYRYGNLELVGVTLPSAPLVPGSTVPVTLDWRAIGAIAQNDVVSVQIFGPAGVRVEDQQYRTDAFPGGGKVLTTRWPPGMGLVDTVPVRLRADIAAPSLVHVDVFVYPDGQKDQPMPATTAAGTAVGIPEVGRLVYGRPAVTATTTPVAVFGRQIALEGVTLPDSIGAGATLPVVLHWRALAAPDAAYTVFVHLGPPDRPPVAQHDQQPLEGTLPTTDWVPGELVNDTVKVPLPTQLAGHFDVYVGMYTASNGTRLLASNGATQVKIGSVRVVGEGS